MYAISFVIKCEIVIKWDTDLCNNTNSNKTYYFYQQKAHNFINCITKVAL